MMQGDTMKNTITAFELNEILNQENLIIIDSSWHLPQAKRNAYQEYCESHIKGAIFYDIDAHSRQDTPLPHMLLPFEELQINIQEIGIQADSRVVIYDSVGIFSCARLWYILKSHGFKSVQVLNGGLPAWVAGGFAMEKTINNPKATMEKILKKSNYIKDKKFIDDAKNHDNWLIIDARSSDRFHSRVPEPRPNTRSGHVDGAINIPYNQVLNADGCLKNPDELHKIFAGKEFDKEIIVYCGSGITAAVILLALESIGKQAYLYDGSWSEYGLITA